MSQTKPQQQGAAPVVSGPRKDWELFWRIIAGLMLLVIGWIVWVLYQITPRSVVTPLVYEARVQRSGAKQPEPGASAVSAQPAQATPDVQAGAGAPAAPQAAPEAAAAALLMDEVQAALRAGAHQASADVQAAAVEKSIKSLEKSMEPVQGEKLKLATEIAMPPADKQTASKQPQAQPDGTIAHPAATSGKARP